MALDGFDSGPRILKIVLKPKSFLTFPTYFMAGLKCGANIKPIPTSSTHFFTTSGSAAIFTPSASSTSPAPLFEEMDLLPCFATGSPDAATTKAEVVEILKEYVQSPPVPTKST